MDLIPDALTTPAARYGRERIDLDALPLNDVQTFNLIRSGKTVGVFQIESQGQIHLLAKHQPETFGDLITEIALFRPAPFFAALIQHRPRMYSQMTLEEEARRFGVEVRGQDIHRSGVRFGLEPSEDFRTGWAIRKPLASVKHVPSDDAQEVVWARLDGPFSSVEDLYTRVAMDIDVFESLARAEALDDNAGSSRGALWGVGILHQRLGTLGQRLAPSLFDQPVVGAEDRPKLPALTESERLSWDLQMRAAARRHPMTLLRRTLQDLEIRTVDTCYRFGRYVPLRSDGPPPRLTVAGLSILRQRPSTASGVTFLTIEDETGFIQCIVYPKVWAAYERVLTAGHVIVSGPLQVDGNWRGLVDGNWRGLVVNEAWRLDGIFGGYEGHPSALGGRDRWIRTVQAGSPKTDVASTEISPTDRSGKSPPEK